MRPFDRRLQVQIPLLVASCRQRAGGWSVYQPVKRQFQNGPQCSQNAKKKAKQSFFMWTTPQVPKGSLPPRVLEGAKTLGSSLFHCFFFCSSCTFFESQCIPAFFQSTLEPPPLHELVLFLKERLWGMLNACGAQRICPQSSPSLFVLLGNESDFCFQSDFYMCPKCL